MPSTSDESFPRREFLKTTGKLATTATITASLAANRSTIAAPIVHVGESNTIRLAIVGCGGRGTGAVAQALRVKNGPIELVAMADVFPQRLKISLASLQSDFPEINIPQDRQFLGFDAYKHAMDCLKPGDVVMLTTPPAFRWVHFSYAIDRGLNVFMEKPVTVDGPSTRRMLELAEASRKKNLKVGVGLMWRHADDHIELAKRLHDGQIGDIMMLRAYRQHGPIASFRSPAKPAGKSELMFQIERFHGFIWASGGAFSDLYVHQIDECCWMKGAWPVEAEAMGGRQYRGNCVDQNFDTYSVEYTFADGAKFFLFGRSMDGCAEQFGSFAHGTKGTAIISAHGHSTDKAQIFSGISTNSPSVWKTGRGVDCYQREWDTLIAAIRNDETYNEVQRGAEASLVTAMGRMAAHTGKRITYDQALNWSHELGPAVDKFVDANSPAPVQAGTDGCYPVPQPGLVTDREYA